jgi:hypothetical protein
MSLFSELNVAYKQGKRARNKGLPISSNPHSAPQDKSNRSHTPYFEWTRGWMAGWHKPKA